MSDRAAGGQLHDWSWNGGLCPVCNWTPDAHPLMGNRCATAPWPYASIERFRATHPDTPAIAPRFYPPLAFADETHEHTDEQLGNAVPDPFKRGAAKNPEAARAAYDRIVADTARRDSTPGWDALAAINAITEREAQARAAREEAEIRAELIRRIERALIKTVDDGPYGDASGHLGGEGFHAMAEAAVDALADFYREGREATVER